MPMVCLPRRRSAKRQMAIGAAATLMLTGCATTKARQVVPARCEPTGRRGPSGGGRQPGRRAGPAATDGRPGAQGLASDRHHLECRAGRRTQSGLCASALGQQQRAAGAGVDGHDPVRASRADRTGSGGRRAVRIRLRAQPGAVRSAGPPTTTVWSWSARTSPRSPVPRPTRLPRHGGRTSAQPDLRQPSEFGQRRGAERGPGAHQCACGGRLATQLQVVQ